MKIKLSKEDFYTNYFAPGDCNCCEHFSDINTCLKNETNYQLDECPDWEIAYECDEEITSEELEKLLENEYQRYKPEDLLKL